MIKIPSCTKVSKNFRLQEFLDKSSGDLASALETGVISLEPFFLYLVPWLQAIRESVGAPVKITSFYRNEQDNKAAGGQSNSAHLKGYAVDFTIPSLFDFPVEQKNLFKRIISYHPHIRVGCYKATATQQFFIHMDCGRIYDSKTFPVWQEIR